MATAQSQHLTWHDLRATGATWMAVRGDDPHKIMQRCGHRSFSTTMLYVREGEAIRDGFGEPFPALPAELLGESSRNRPGTIRQRRSSQKQAVRSGVDGTRTRPRAPGRRCVDGVSRGYDSGHPPDGCR
ncbi:MAG: site-specific integrase [Myxococcales bacterium]|nr:site-specific integrase [Myxococcales bacterium]